MVLAKTSCDLPFVIATDLGTSGQHLLAGVQPGSTSLLNLLDLATSLADPMNPNAAPGQRRACQKPMCDPTHTLPILLLGIINLIVTGRLPGMDGWSNGSSLILLTMSPKACWWDQSIFGPGSAE